MSIDLDEVAIICDPWTDEPVFHRYTHVGAPGEGYTTNMSLQCGQSTRDDRGFRKAQYLQRRHAEKFARPCRRCFP